MIVTFIRSSSYAEHDLCPHSFFLTYNLGIRSPSGKAADKGNIVHKALEMLARVKKAQQQGDTFYVDDIFGKLNLVDVNPAFATEQAWEYYTKLAPHTIWYDSDLEDCFEWTYKALTFNNGMFDPRKHNIIEAEQEFDFIIPKRWAEYSYELYDGEIVEGYLGLKGTMDLVVQDHDDVVEIIDWKTGRRRDWVTGQEKTYKKLRHADAQLRLYHYAANQLFPHAKEIFISIYFINHGGPFTLCFSRKDLELTERIIKNKFNQIRETIRPALHKTWKCNKFCFFGMNKHPENPEKTYCEFFKDKVREDGILKVMNDYGVPNAFNAYGSGGGRREKT